MRKKDELKEFLKLWESMTVEELMDKFKVKKHTIVNIAGRFRKQGIKLTQKRRRGYVDSLIAEVAKEFKKK